MKILIIEDEEIIRRELATLLIGYGYEIELVTDFSNALEQIKQMTVNLILLDINLPFFDGHYLCREIRKFSQVPIIIVTSKDSDMDELMSMNLGADDFITKPYHTQILLARIESILKRVYGQQSTSVYQYKELRLDIERGCISVGPKEQVLTKNELRILCYLMKNKGKIISREELMEYLWSTELFMDDNTLSVNITRLRKKIESLGLQNPIETRRGLGYIMP